MAKTTNWIAIAALLVGVVKCQVEQKICSWPQLRAAVVRDSLYLDGGQMSMNDWQDEAWLQNSSPTVRLTQDGTLFGLNFSKEFNVKESNFTSLFVPLAEAVGPYAAPQYLDGFMFADDYEFYTYGGLPVNTPSTSEENIVNYQLYEPNLGASRWQAGPNPDFVLQGVTNLITNGAGANARSEMLGFYFSGMRSISGDVIVASPGSDDTQRASVLSTTMIQIDMSEFGAATWSNITLPNDIQPRAEAQMVWIPIGEKGSLIVIGGVTAPADIFDFALSSEQTASSTESSPAFMTSIPIYDIAGEQWHVQNTSGTAPGQLAQFCSVVASADDISSFEIFVYGGYDGVDYTASDDVWILSVPAFEWIKAYNGKSEHARSAHFCTMPYPDQMFSIGGQNLANGLCIIDGTIVDIFNLNSLQWQDTYSPTNWSEYRIHPLVTNVIGGNEHGGATLKADMEPALATLFETKYQKQTVTYYPYTSSHTKKNHWLAPVLGTVVGLLGLALVVFFIWWCRRPQRKRRLSTVTSESTIQGSRISRWIHGTPAPGLNAPKSVLSETTTELEDPAMSPFNTVYEAHGDEYFHHGSPQPVYEVGDVRSDMMAQSNTPLRSSHSLSTGPGSPRLRLSPSLSNTVEVDGLERFEMQGVSRKSQAAEMAATATLIRNTNLEGSSNGLGIEDSIANFETRVQQRSPANLSQQSSITDPKFFSPDEIRRKGAGIKETSSFNRQYGWTPNVSNGAHKLSRSSIEGPEESKTMFASVIPIDTSVNTNPIISNGTEPLSMSATSGPMPATLSPVDPKQYQPQWPSHKRNSSSLSSGPIQLPSPGVEEEKRRSVVITSLPESPSSVSGNAVGNIIARKQVGSSQQAMKSAYTENMSRQQHGPTT